MVDSNQVYERVIRFLARRAHSRAELLRKLGERGVSPEAAREAVERAAAEGYVDDGKFALDFARHGLNQQGWAPARTRNELHRRGVAREQAEAAVREVYADVDLIDLAIDLARRRAARLTGELESRRRRISAYLERRGFPTAVSRAATDEVAPL
jgi:regulatory protein